MTVAVAGPAITSLSELRELVGEPSERARLKQLPALDAHCRAFIARSPFLLLGTANAAGTCDVSPKGDAPGFVPVLDATTLVIPDRPGNRRFDSLQNILENPHVGLLFLIPGMDETLRVNGIARLTRDPSVLDLMAVGGKQPLLGILVNVQECFLHCARSFLRAQLWDPSQFMQRDDMPSLTRMIQDQIRSTEQTDAEHERLVVEGERRTRDSYSCLY
jgi:PPOX class probable FMN-dependent enzyme